MFCVAYLGTPLTIAFRVREDEFDELSESAGIIPAPYMARNKWIQVQDMSCFSPEEWKHYIYQSYEYKKGKLTKKVLKELGLSD